MASVALAENVTKIRPFRLITAAPSLTLKPRVSQSIVGTAMRTGALERVEGDDMEAMYRLEFTPVSLCAQSR
ncbi:hypothetical protein FQZ97_1027260 [compost metagenome]